MQKTVVNGKWLDNEVMSNFKNPQVEIQTDLLKNAVFAFLIRDTPTFRIWVYNFIQNISSLRIVLNPANINLLPHRRVTWPTRITLHWFLIHQVLKWMSNMYLCTLFPFYMLLTYFLIVGKIWFLAHNYILLIHLDVMNNFGDDQ